MRDLILSLLGIFFLVCMAFALGVWTMVNGYGVAVQSYPVLILGAAGQFFLTGLITALGRPK